MRRLIAVITLIAVADSSYAIEVLPWSTAEEFSEADLVVRGVIRGFEFFDVPAREYWGPGYPENAAPVQIPCAWVVLDLTEVISGDHNGDPIRFVVPGMIAPGRGGFADIAYNYEVNDDIVVSLHFRDSFLGGAYQVGDDYGRFIRDGGWFVRQREPELRLRLNDVRRLAQGKRVRR